MLLQMLHSTLQFSDLKMRKRVLGKVSFLPKKPPIVPVVEFVDFVEDSDCRDDLTADGDVAFPFEWDVVEASCAGEDREVRSQVEASPASYLQGRGVEEDHVGHSLAEASPASCLQVP